MSNINSTIKLPKANILGGANKTFLDPYLRIEIETVDNNNVITSDFENWYSTSADSGTWNEAGINWIALNSESSDNTYSLSQNISIAESGEYHVYIRANLAPFTELPDYYVDFAMDGASIADKIDFYSLDRSISMIDLGTMTIDQGVHEFTAVSTKYAYLGTLVLKKIRRFWGNNRGQGNLWIAGFDFTLGDNSQLNTFELSLVNQPGTYPYGYIDNNSPSGFVFDYRDSINIWLGETRLSATQVFGGYITTPELDIMNTPIPKSSITADNAVLKISGADRLLDWTQRPCYKTINIAGAVGGNGTTDGPSFDCTSFYDVLCYLCSTTEYQLDYSLVTNLIKNTKAPDIGMHYSFNDETNYNNVLVNYMNKSWVLDPSFGKVLQLGNGTDTSDINQQATVWDCDTAGPKFGVNAAKFNVLEFAYMARSTVAPSADVKKSTSKTSSTTSSTGAKTTTTITTTSNTTTNPSTKISTTVTVTQSTATTYTPSKTSVSATTGKVSVTAAKTVVTIKTTTKTEVKNPSTGKTTTTTKTVTDKNGVVTSTTNSATTITSTTKATPVVNVYTGGATQDTIVGMKSASLICGENESLYPWGTFYEVTFINKCPVCGAINTLSYGVPYKPFPAEGEITCDKTKIASNTGKPGCDSDFDAVYLQCKKPSCDFITGVGNPEEYAKLGQGIKPFLVGSNNAPSASASSTNSDLQDSVNNPYLFVIRVWYYKAGESYATEMHDTFINFTGYEGTTAAGLSGNVLGEVQPQLEDGVWKTFSFDLLEALSIMDPSTAYYITEIDFINQLDGTTTNLQDRVMEFAWIQMRDGSALVSETLDSSGKMQLDILNSMIGASTDTYQNYIVNTIYARERRHDKLNVYVKGTVNNDFDIIQGVNLFNLQNQKYTPKDDLINCETIVYPVDNAGDYGLSQQINPTSANRYAILDNYQTNTDVESMYYESEQTAELLKEQADVEWSYDAIVTGAPNLQIGGLINAYLDENFLAGEQLVTMGKYVFDRTVTSTPLLTVAVSLQKPSHQFLAKLKDKQLRRLLNPAGTASNIYRAVDPAYSDYIYSGYSIQTAPAASAPGKPGTTSGNASGPNLKLFTDVTGTTLTNAQSLYTWMHDNFTWEDYNSDEKSNPQLVNEWKASHHVRANCTDMSQFCYILLKELGYTVNYKHGDIVCSTGVWGHVWLSIQGNEYSKATIFDPTACTQPDVNKPLGHLTCEEGAPYNVSTDDAWLLARDTTLSN